MDWKVETQRTVPHCSKLIEFKNFCTFSVIYKQRLGNILLRSAFKTETVFANQRQMLMTAIISRQLFMIRQSEK